MLSSIPAEWWIKLEPESAAAVLVVPFSYPAWMSGILLSVRADEL